MAPVEEVEDPVPSPPAEPALPPSTLLVTVDTTTPIVQVPASFIVSRREVLAVCACANAMRVTCCTCTDQQYSSSSTRSPTSPHA